MIRAGTAIRAIPGVVVALTGEVQLASAVEELSAEVRSPSLSQPVLGLGDSAGLDVPRHWEDAWSVELSAEASVVDSLPAWASLGYHTPVSPDRHMDVAALDGHRIVFGGGVRWVASLGIHLLAEAKVHKMLEREVQASIHDLGNGRYGMWAAVGSLGVELLR